MNPSGFIETREYTYTQNTHTHKYMCIYNIYIFVIIHTHTHNLECHRSVLLGLSLRTDYFCLLYFSLCVKNACPISVPPLHCGGRELGFSFVGSSAGKNLFWCSEDTLNLGFE